MILAYACIRWPPSQDTSWRPTRDAHRGARFLPLSRARPGHRRVNRLDELVSVWAILWVQLEERLHVPARCRKPVQPLALDGVCANAVAHVVQARQVGVVRSVFEGTARVGAPASTPQVSARAAGDSLETRQRETVQADLAGHARVIDGDTIEVDSARVRLFGIDAPESAQGCLAGSGRRWCGEQATRALAGRIGGRSVACEERDQDRYGRIVAVCHHGGQDVNAWLVHEGWAMAYRRYSTAYVDQEEAARRAKRGIWRGQFVAPGDWRRGDRLKAATRDAPHASSGDRCDYNIKGNISHNRGKRIYHMPGDRDYERTRISTSRGER